VKIYNDCENYGIESCDVCAEELQQQQEEAQKKHADKHSN